jgi:hypothetical protein
VSTEELERRCVVRAAVKHVLFVAAAVVAFAALHVPAFAQGPCPCVLPDNGTGTATMPPDCIEGYLGWLTIDTGIVGGTIEIDATLFDFTAVAELPGGSLGGTQSSFNGLLRMEMMGTGSLAGFTRNIVMPLPASVIDWGPRILNDPVQPFPGDIRDLSGEVFGDPDFDVLKFRSGWSFGLPSPGSTTLTRLGPPGSDFEVDSFFDVFYEIEYVGAPGSVLEGFGGTVERLTRFQTCPAPAPVEEARWGTIKALYR